MEKKSDLPEFTTCHCANLRWISREVSSFYRSFIGASGIVNTQYTLLSFLKLYGPLPLNEFAKITHLDRTTLIRNLKILEKNGLVASFFEKTSGITQKAITEKGLEILKIADPGWDKAQEAFKSLFNDTEWEYFYKILEKLRKINLQTRARTGFEPENFGL
jgi:DNA-binding MarR family transcriptional regulator